MKFKALLTFILSLIAINASAIDFENPSYEDCKANANTLGYTITIKEQCNLDTDDSENELVKLVNELNNKCIANYGKKTMANGTRLGIYSAKEEFEKTGKNSTCYRALDEFPELFN